MTKTIIALYDDRTDARNAVEELVDANVARENISLVARDFEGTYTEGAGRDIARDEEADEVARGAAAGAAGGAVVGGLAGVLLGLGAFAIPGIGPVVAAGPLAAGLAGAGIGAATGGLLGALIEWGIPEEHAEYYAEGVRRGGTLVSVQTPEDRVSHVTSILNKHYPVDVEQRATTWREAGWAGYDPEAEAYRETELPRRTERTREPGQAMVHRYIERAPVDRSRVGDFGDYHNDFRRHYDQTFSGTTYGWTDYEPAYHYGYTLAADEQYADRDWDEIEPEVRRRWESEYQDSAWDDFKDSVRYAWRTVKRKVRETF